MKTTSLLATAAFAVVTSISSQAFTLDAVGYEGGELSPAPWSVSVPGYGELIFETAAGSPLVISSGYENPQDGLMPLIRFDGNDAIRVTFNGARVFNVEFYFASLSGNDGVEVADLTQSDLSIPQTFRITLRGTSDSVADLYAITWNSQSVPEPSTTLLGMVGVAGLVFRRCRR
jgi:PEP-CTERM motif